jgi:hypothetical protein
MMNVAIGRMQLNVTLSERPAARGRDHSGLVTPAAPDAERAYERERRRQAVEADRQRWSSMIQRNGPQRV